MRPLINQSVRLFAVVCALFACVSVGHAGAPKKPKVKPKIAYLEIATVDAKAMTITIQPKNSTANTSKTYKFTAQTKITVNGQPGTVNDLKPGLQIRVGTGANDDMAEELSASPPPADPNEKR